MNFKKFEFDSIVYTNGRLLNCIFDELIINCKETKGLQEWVKEERSIW